MGKTSGCKSVYAASRLTDTRATDGATLHANLTSAATGSAGAVLALEAGGSFVAGRHEIARLQFNLLDPIRLYRP